MHPIFGAIFALHLNVKKGVLCAFFFCEYLLTGEAGFEVAGHASFGKFFAAIRTFSFGLFLAGHSVFLWGVICPIAHPGCNFALWVGQWGGRGEI